MAWLRWGYHYFRSSGEINDETIAIDVFGGHDLRFYFRHHPHRKVSLMGGVGPNVPSDVERITE